LTVMKAKEDTKNNDQERKPAVIKAQEHKVEVAPENELLGNPSSHLGFRSGLASEPRKPREDREKERPAKTSKPEGKKAAKPVINEEDFPAL
jgi:hypothetical protein